MSTQNPHRSLHILSTEIKANRYALAFFQQVVNHPKSIVLFMITLMISVLYFLPMLTKDTRSDAFLAADNPALVYREKVKDQFGLSDPMVIAVVNEGEQGIYNPKTLKLVQWLSDEVMEMDNINPDRVMSLATENNITGTKEGMEVTPFFDTPPSTPDDMARLKAAIDDFPLYQGALVAKNGKATLLVLEMEDEALVETTYQSLLEVLERAPIKNGEVLHVAGEGAIAGFMGRYIDSDAQRLNPLAGLVITVIMFIAFRRFSPAILGNVIIAASVLMTLGLMAAANVPFYVVTNALPVILIGISVADAIHIFNEYFELQIAHPDRDKKDLVVDAMIEMWRPVTLTTLTTAAGFLGLYFAAYMPPFKYFGLFTALGVMVAWFYSMFFLPAAMALIKPTVSPKFVGHRQQGRRDLFSSLIVSLGGLTLKHSKSTIVFFSLVIVAGVYAASHLQVDEDRIKTFDPGEPIYQADKVINRYLDGSNNIDIVVETNYSEALFETDNLSKMEALQKYALTLPYVQSATSIVDYLKQMNRALNDGDTSEYRLPESKEQAAQYFLIYSASGDPTDFEEEVDYDYRLANIRLILNEGAFQNTRDNIEALQRYIDTQFNTSEIKATLSGRVNVNYHWIKDLGESHFSGLAIALFLVWLVSAVLFRSLLAGVFSLIPVAGSILLVYSTMVALNIHLGIGTSMFASVAIGLGVDFAIHTIDRLRSLYQDNANSDLSEVIKQLYPSTGRALFFNFLAIACGFGVLISSKVVPLTNFGMIVVLAVTTSFIASMALLPALVSVFKPRFVTNVASPKTVTFLRVRTLAIILGAGAAVGLLLSQNTEASELPRADWIIQQINQEDDGEFVSRRLTMTMIDRRGKERTRETVGYRKYFEDQKRTIIFYRKPSNVKGTGFMTYDYFDAEQDDDQWLYLPALRKVRRISASDRGDYFLGTDFTYDDIKKEGKIELADFHYTCVAEETINGYQTYKLEGLPQSKSIAKELGYGRMTLWVDQTSWSIVKADYWDIKDRHLKTLLVEDIRRVDGIWTRHKMRIHNHKTGHKTVFEFSEVDYKTPVKDSLFSKRALAKGK